MKVLWPFLVHLFPWNEFSRVTLPIINELFIFGSFKDSDCNDDYAVIREVIRDVDGFCSIEYIDAKKTHDLLAQSLERISGYSYRSESFVNVS